MEDEIYLNNELTFNNDASASSYGWNFQANAGIFLFLQDIKSYESIKIESKYQDIEITKIDGTKILAQAKSSVDFSKIAPSAIKSKMKDAIISLAKNADVGNKLIYICNIPSIINGYSHIFDNTVVNYQDAIGAAKDEIDNLLKDIEAELNNKIIAATSEKERNKLKSTIEKIQKFPREKFAVSVIYPYYGDDKNRYIAISQEIINFLSTNAGLPSELCTCLKPKLLRFWQNKFSHNSSVKDGLPPKIITKYSFAWPIVVYLAEEDLPNDVECSFALTDALRRDAKNFITSDDYILLEQFETVNIIINSFVEYLTKHPDVKSGIEKDFVNQFWDKFNLTFNYDNDDQKREYFSKVFIRKILSRYDYVKKINKAIGVK